MCEGIALAASELPEDFIETNALDMRLHDRGGEKEFRFLYKDAHRVIPVWHEGQLCLVRWGNRRCESSVLPSTGWAWLSSIEEGKWAVWSAESVEIPAMMGLENGVWFKIQEGIQGLLVYDETGVAVVYMICEPATHYYEIMTKSKRMPVLIGERI
jgi:hypothetical protein